MPRKMFGEMEIVAVADLDISRARAKAEEHGIGKALSPDELLSDPDVEIVVNLTIPAAHYSVCKAALEGGKHVYVEKPLTITRDEGRELLQLAAKEGLRVGGAPDTFLGAGLQTCRALIDSGAIGTPVGASAFMLCRGHESWHPDPEFYYKVGGGPLFDMGPYYLTALVSLLGPLARVSGSARATFPTRTVTSEAKRGTVITVDVPTHIAGVLDFENGAIGTLTTSFDVSGSTLPPIEVYGSEGTLLVPDPNGFGGPVKVKRGKDWEDVPVTRAYSSNARGVGVADMAQAIVSGRAHRASGELCFHVLDAMHGLHDASASGQYTQMEPGGVRPAPFPEGLAEGEIDR